MSLSIFQTIYNGLVQFIGAEWLVWVLLAVALLAVFASILRVNFIVIGLVSAIPFMILAIYSAINVASWIYYLLFFFFGIVLALALWKLLTRT